jgi:hypothetical protein
MGSWNGKAEFFPLQCRNLNLKLKKNQQIKNKTKNKGKRVSKIQ